MQILSIDEVRKIQIEMLQYLVNKILDNKNIEVRKCTI